MVRWFALLGEGEDAPEIAVTIRDVRCSMLNIDPDSANSDPEVMKAIVRANQNNAGIYATVTSIGELALGQSVFLTRELHRPQMIDYGHA